MSTVFETEYEVWLQAQIDEEHGLRRKERLQAGLGHGTIEFLRGVWFPAVGHFEHLHPEWEVRDFSNGYRYLDLAYMPAGAKGGIEIQGYASHARDLDVRRFKDLCRRHCLMALDGWLFLPIAYPSIVEEPKQCQQLVLSFIGKFISSNVSTSLNAAEAEAVRYARRLLRPFSPGEFADHIKVSPRHARRILGKLTELHLLRGVNGTQRVRSYQIRLEAD